jgi:hypothetical protein
MRRRIIAILTVLALPLGLSSRVHAAQTLALATGQVVTGDATGLNVQPFPATQTVNTVNVDSPIDTMPDPTGPPGNNSKVVWGYEASFASPHVRSYHFGPPVTPIANCVPDPAVIPAASNGRGMAFDPLDGDLWISRLTVFTGDDKIWKIVPPQATPTPGVCPVVTSLTVHDKAGNPPAQTGFGALDVDDGSKHIWAAGYIPVLQNGVLKNFFYLVNRNNGLILRSCYLTTLNPFAGNDSLAFAHLDGLPGSGRYLLTDNGEFVATDPILAIDTDSCHDGQQATVVASFPKTRGMTGIDFEWPGLLNTDVLADSNLYNNGNQPFTTSTLYGPWGDTTTMEDISLCGFRATFGGRGNDFCPYP